MKCRYLNTKNNQRGLSLVELMISMVVGLFLLAGVVTNFISTSGNDRMRDAVSEMDANASYAMKTLRQTITHAGYGTTNNVKIDKPFFTALDPNIAISACATTSSRVTDINNNRTRDSGDKDIISIIYLADNPCKNNAASCTAGNSPNINENALVFTDCSGGGSDRIANDVACSTDPSRGLSDPTQAKIYNTFRILDSDNSLTCNGTRRDNGQTVVENVHALQFLYGVRDEGTASTAYRTATQVQASDQWGLVRSVQVGILMRSSKQNLLKADNTNFKFKVLDKEVVIPSADRRRLYRLYTSTINLENLNKEPLGEGT